MVSKISLWEEYSGFGIALSLPALPLGERFFAVCLPSVGLRSLTGGALASSGRQNAFLQGREPQLDLLEKVSSPPLQATSAAFAS